MPITGNLLIEWTSNYSLGCHRIGYRVQGSGAYTVINNIASPYCNPGIAESCAYSIGPLSFENESCDDVVYEYYVQPCCENPVSEDGRVYGTITFTPSPTCTAIQYTCSNGGLPCGPFNLGNNCDGTPKGSVTVPDAEVFITCYSTLDTPPDPTGTGLIALPVTDCCYDCLTYQLSGFATPGTLTYSDCTNNGNTTIVTLTEGGSSFTICAVVGSVFVSGTATITPLTSCPFVP